MTLPSAIREHLAAPSLESFWQRLRDRLERTGHAVGGSIAWPVDEDGLDRLSGLLGRHLSSPVRLGLVELDAALRRSAAARGLPAVVAELTGAPLRDRPAERATREQAWARVWQALDDDLVRTGLARHEWAGRWVQWLRSIGVVHRLGIDDASPRLRATVDVLAELDAGLADRTTATRPLGELASRHTGDAHGLDDGRTSAALVLRAASFALEVAPPESSAGRRELWRRLGVESDLVSGTVLVWGLRPPGSDPWSRMMNARADLGLVTHLTMRELRNVDPPLTAPGVVVHGCENPQVLQALADAGVDAPLLCVSGNPSAVGLRLATSVRLRYHGDFDWPGIAIASRLVAAGAQPWRLGTSDYLDALAAHAAPPLPLSGAPQVTPWDERLAPTMTRRNVAVHEEALIDTLLTDLR